jgi:fluoride exporter
MSQLFPVLTVAIGGGIGAALRYLLSGAVYRVVGTDFPYGTLAVNLLGSLFLGWLMETTEYTAGAAPMLRLFLGVGVCGGFTTFSTFSYETMRLLTDGVYLQALLNISGSVVLCVLGIWLGMLLARII